MEIEVGEGFVREVARLLGKSATEEAPSPENSAPEVDEAVMGMKVQGAIQLRGFSKETVATMPATLKFHMQLANLGERIRIIVDIQK
jgi:hypothetical protein